MTRFSVCVVLLLLFVASPDVLAQPDAPALSDGLSTFISQTVRLVPGEREKLLTFAAPLPLPSISVVNVASTKVLVPLWCVPSVGPDSHLLLGDKPISTLFQEYFDKEDNFVLGERKLSEDEMKRLATALSVLFDDPDNRAMPTKKYARYREWQTKRKAILDEINKTPSANEKTALNQKLVDADQDYNLLGEKNQVEAAIEVVTKNTSDAPMFQPQFKKVRELASPEQDVVVYGQFLTRVGSPAAWVRIASDVGSAKLPKAIEVKVFLEGGAERTHTVPIRWFSCQAINVRLDQPLLSADILGNRAWKRRDAKVLSDGAVGKADSGALPYFVSSVLVIRDLELEFDVKSDAYAQMADNLGSALKATVGKLPVDFRGPGSAYVLPGRLYVPKPTTLAAVVATPARFPNTAQDLEWK